ncbi:unnamed protein product, partial [Notodromas monacha]
EQERQKLANKAQRRKDKPKKNALDKKSYNSLLDWINSDEPAGRPEVAKSILFDNDTDSEEDDDEGDDDQAVAAAGPHRHYNNDDKEVKDEKQKKKTTTTKKKKSVVVATPAAKNDDEERNDDTLQRLQLQHQAGEKSFLDDILGQVLDFSDDDDDKNNASGKDQHEQQEKKKKKNKTVEELRWKNIRHADYFRVIEWVTNGRDDDLHEARDLLFKEDEVMEREDREADEAFRQRMMTDFSSTRHD